MIWALCRWVGSLGTVGVLIDPIPYGISGAGLGIIIALLRNPPAPPSGRGTFLESS